MVTQFLWLIGVYGEGSEINIFENPDLPGRLEAGVYQSVLEQMAPYSGSSTFIRTDRVDCETDPCHLAWLIRDNPHFIKNVKTYYSGNTTPTCTNGTRFVDLNPNAYNDCPV